MALTQRIAQIAVVLAAFVCIVVSQDPSLFTNIQSTVGGQAPAPTTGFDFNAMGGGGGMAPGFGGNFGMPAPRSSNHMQSMLPYLMFRSGDFAQTMLMMQMMGGAGGMGTNPLLMYGLMNSVF